MNALNDNRHDYALPLRVATQAALEAANLIRKEANRRGGPRGRLGHCPVDRQVEVLLRKRLRASFPDWPFYGEETGLTGKRNLHHWLVDPHDGTSAFQRGFRGTAISVALLRGVEPVLGVVLAPCPPVGDEDLITWAEGCGPVQRNGLQVERRWPTELDDRVVVLVSQDADTKPTANLRMVHPARFLAVASVAYRMALTGAGEGDVGVSLAPTLDYDFAAAHAIIKGAGGSLLDARGRPVHYASTGGSKTGSAGLLVGGAPDLVRTLVQRPWPEVLTTPSENVPFIAPRRHHTSKRSTNLDRAQGLLLGQLVGDALGAQVEFQTAVQIARQHPDGVRAMDGGGPWSIAAGQPTDDSEMALALARALVEDGTFNAQNVARTYVEWYRSGPFDIGGTVKAACEAGASALDRGLDVVQTMRASASPDSQANGALMRISPLALLGHRDIQTCLEWAQEDARLTHPHQVCQAANVAFVAALCAALDGAESGSAMLQKAQASVAAMAGAESVLERLDAAMHAPPARLDDANMGWVLHALQNAFFELLHADSFEEALVATVARGGDTDTNGAITGALVGALHGAKSVPDQWRRAVLTCRASQPGFQPRPQQYWAADILMVAEELTCASEAAVWGNAIQVDC